MKTFIIEQKIKLFVNHYRVYGTDKNGNKGSLIAYAKQKPLALKEAITFYADATSDQPVFKLKARKVIDLAAKYDVTDANGQALGTIGKVFKASLLRSTWHVYRPGEETTPVVVARERSQGLALLRRVWDLIPIIGDVPFLAKYHFDFTDPESSLILATYNKTTTFRDHYRLGVQEELLNKVDWRPVVALGIMMDALQSR